MLEEPVQSRPLFSRCNRCLHDVGHVARIGGNDDRACQEADLQHSGAVLRRPAAMPANTMPGMMMTATNPKGETVASASSHPSATAIRLTTRSSAARENLVI